MDRWRNKIAVVTGASSGIGWAVAQELLQANIVVVGLSLTLRSEEDISKELSLQQAKLFHQKQCDLSSIEEIRSAFKWIAECFKQLHILINNAGMCEFSRILDENNEESLKRVLDVNLMAAVFCTKEAYKLMKISMACAEECHIVNMCSLLGHHIMPHIPECGFNLYPVAKHALRAANEVLRKELSKDKLIRLSSISPGLTATKFGSYVEKPTDLMALPDTAKLLEAQDIARAVRFVLESPAHVNIAEMLIVPTSELKKVTMSVRQLRLLRSDYWKNEYAIVIMSHTKAGYPIVLALLELGMYVVAVSPQLKKNETLRHHLDKHQRKRYFTKQVDLNTINSINMLICELKSEVQQVKLFLCLVPQINEDEKCNIFEKCNVALLQTILEVSELGVGAVCATALRHIIFKDFSHMWLIRFHHQEPDLVHDYLENLMGLGCKAPKVVNVKLLRKKETDVNPADI